MMRYAYLLAAVLVMGCTQPASKPSPGINTMSNLSLTSPAFEDGGQIPDRYGYTEENVNPPLNISGVPPGAESLVLVMDDPDAKPVVGHVFDHWVLYNIPPGVESVEEGESPGVEGENDYGDMGYGGPNPPDRPHTYVFELFALDTELNLSAGATKEEVENAMEGHVIARDRLEGTYSP